MNRAISAVSYAFNASEKTILSFMNNAKERQMPKNVFGNHVESPRFALTYVRKKSKMNLTDIQDTQRTPFIIPTKCTFLINTDIK
jgi:hypothetical protein